MKSHWLATSLLFVVTATVALPAAADVPVAGIFPGVTINADPTPVRAGETKLGALNIYGPTVFELKNASNAPITSLLVTVDAGAPSSGARCSTLTGQALPTCTTQVVGNSIHVHFSGGEIGPNATFRLGFAPDPAGASWPSNRPVTVTVNGQPE